MSSKLSDITAETIESGQRVGGFMMKWGSILGFIIAGILFVVALYFGFKVEPDFVLTNGRVINTDCESTGNGKWDCKYDIVFQDQQGITRTIKSSRKMYRNENDVIEVQYERGKWYTANECCKIKNVYIGLIISVVALGFFLSAWFQWYFRKEKSMQTAAGVNSLRGRFTFRKFVLDYFL